MTDKLFISTRFEASCFTPGQLLPEEDNLPEIAVAGRSNVGKSSLINALLGSKLAHTGSTPGKTRSINFYRVTTSSGDFRLADLPGYGYAERSKNERNEWQKLTAAYMKKRNALRLVLHLVDFRHGLLKNDRALQEWLTSMKQNILVVFTKADKIPKSKWRKTREDYVKAGMFSFDMPVITSSEKREGIDALSEFIAKNLPSMKL